MIDKNRPVLVADDDEYFRLALTALLRGPLGFAEVVDTASLGEALERLSTAGSHYSLALFDLSMPGMDGPATLGAVRKDHPELCVAVVSASQSRLDVLMALETGVHGYIPKAFGPAGLIRALNIVIAGDIFVPTLLAEGFLDGKSLQPTYTARTFSFEGPRPIGKPPFPEMERSGEDVIASISPRQREVLALLVRGYSNKQIANELSLGEGTIKIHVAAVLRSLGVSNRAGAAATGARLLSA